ncbi:MAG: ORF6N domain-containing protein [Firmicutes bacterium]|nr:ORF6N domain-containing protein [Bacillota bacterium]
MEELIISDIKIEDMIYEIRGMQVMLASDLAKLYECKNGTKEINQAVKNNIEKFPERFTWKLTDEESKIFLVKNFDQKSNVDTH